jgi:DNA polymerase iota
MGPDVLERLLGGSGTPHGIGNRVWDLLNGSDDTSVSQAREIPRQISIEDSYIKLDTIEQVTKQLRILAISLLRRMRTDLIGIDQDPAEEPPAMDTAPVQRWLAHPKTVRLSTRPRPPQNPDGSRNRSFARISKSAPMPNFVFNLKTEVEVLAEKMVRETLIPLFRQLHPEKYGWNLSLVNIAAANMVEGASEKGGAGRDIGKMFKQQDTVLSPFKVQDESIRKAIQDTLKGGCMPVVHTEDEYSRDDPRPYKTKLRLNRFGSEDYPTPSQEHDSDIDDVLAEDVGVPYADLYRCDICGATMPPFAMGAHERWHIQG